MNESGKPPGKLVVVAMLLTVVVVATAITLTFLRGQAQRRPRLPVLFSIPDFTLTNQQGRAVTLADLQGKAWVADIIFTRCAGPCPKMTRRMSELQSAFAQEAPVRFVSLTTDAEFDTPSVLAAYAQRFGAQPERWWFLTGDKRTIANLAIDGFKFVSAEKKPEDRTDPADLFVHSTFFVVVDGQGRARAVCDYEEPDSTAWLVETVRLLLRER